jgi:ketosteroid isomerase-like protein
MSRIPVESQRPHAAGLLMMTTREVVERYYAAVNDGEWSSWLTLFSDDVVGDEQLAGHFVGIDTLRRAVDAIKEGYSKFKMYPVRIVIDGESAAVIWRNDSANAKGQPIAYPTDPNRQVIGANFFQVQNGKIVYMRTVHDSLPFKPFTDQNT